MKPSEDNDNMIKRGCGNQSNSSAWSAAYNKEYKKYVAMLQFGSAYGGWMSLYEISKETFDKAGTFENDDYLTERMIRKGRLLYKYENDRNSPEPMNFVKDENYEELCRILLENK